MASYLSQIQVGENTYHINPVIATENTSGTAAVTTSPYTASIWRINLPEITELYTGLTILYKVPVAGNATYGTLLRINGTDASSDSSSNLYPVCANVNTMIGTRYAVDCIVALTFDASQVGLKLYYNSDSASTTVEGGTGWTKPGCWKISDYNTNDNTIGYQLRGNYYTLPLTHKTYRYRLLFTSADGTHFVPANASTSTNATAKRDVILTKIDPFGEIVYYGYTSAVNAEATISAARLWSLYNLTLGYSFNRTGAALVLDFPKAVYVKCAPQADGSAIIDPDTPYVQTLPNTADGKIYIFLGVAYAETTIELLNNHPVYYYSDAGGIKLWTGTVLTSTLPNSSSTDLQFPTSKAVYDYVQSLPEPMIFKGSVGDSGDNPTVTWTNLPSASSSEGYTYKVITAHASTPVCKVGDTIISNGTDWIVIPSGDEPSGTVTSVATGTGLTGGTITSSGTIKTKLLQETPNTASAARSSGTTQLYATEVDKDGYLATRVPWTDTTYKITLNGTTNGDSSGTDLGTLYAPTTAGTSGQVLKSNGSGAPTWANAVLTDDKVLQSSSTSNNTYPVLASVSTNPNGSATTTIYNNNTLRINPYCNSVIIGDGYASGSLSLAVGNGNAASAYCVAAGCNSGSSLYAGSDASFVFGYTNNEGSIYSDGNGSFAGGYSIGSSAYETPTIASEGNGSLSYGSVDHDGRIEANDEGAVAFGKARGEDDNENEGTSGGYIAATLLGAFARGFSLGAAAYLELNDEWIGSDSNIRATAEGASAQGYSHGGDILATGHGAYAGGYSHVYIDIWEEEGDEEPYNEYDMYPSKIEASGLGAVAYGYSEGGLIQASGKGAVAIGYCDYDESIVAQGIGSFAGGTNATALSSYSFAFGTGVSATKIGAFAIGIGSRASGQYSLAFGNSSYTSGNYSHAEGYSTTASGTASHAEGQGVYAIGTRSHAEGYCATASTLKTAGAVSSSTTVVLTGVSVTLDGTTENITTGDVVCIASLYRYIISVNTSTNTITVNTALSCSSGDTVYVLRGVAYENRSHSEGALCNATHADAHAEGYKTTAYGNKSHAEGYRTTAYGAYSHAEGCSTWASGETAHAEGYSTNASGTYSHAGGYGTIADKTCQTAIGRYNAANSNGDLFTIGNGASSSSKKTIFKVADASGSSGNNAIVTVTGKVNASEGFFQTSDIREKNILGDLDLEKAYDLIDKCQTIIYSLKDDESNKEQIGLIAQEVKEFFPEIVSEDKDGMLSLDYARLTVVILKVLKDLINRVNTLERRII